MVNMQSQTTTHPSSISQKAALAALTGSVPEVEVMVAEFRRRRDYIVGRLNGLKNFSCVNPDGAFYAFPRISDWFGKDIKGERVGSSSDMARILLEKAGVAVVPGAEFGSDAHLRFSYATSMEKIRQGMDRLEALVE